MDKFADIEAFVTVVRTGSFSAAGEKLGIAKSVVSRRVSQLEKYLGSRLLTRTTRRLSLTDSGRNFHLRALQILADLDDAEQVVTKSTTELRGEIRLAAPVSFGHLHLSRALAGFLDEHPAIELNVDFNDRQVNLVEEGFDMAVRIGQLENSTLIARRIGLSRQITCASESYLDEHGEPLHPNDLEHHIGLQYSNVGYRQQWQYLDDRKNTIHARPVTRLRANNGEALAAAAVAGHGITTGPSFILAGYLGNGSLKIILDDYQQPSLGIYAVYPPGRLLPRRVQALSDYLTDVYGDHPYWDRQLSVQHSAADPPV
jgi:DNA-binding transcriptional LysR family regulator